MEYKGLKLDDFQIEAIKAIEENKSVVVSAPTGSGKTLIADYIIDRDVKKGVKVIYTAPIKALSNQKYKDFCREYGEENVGLITGDTVKNPEALVVVMTTEIYRNMAIADDATLKNVSYIIFDEIHYINDIERGYVWEESIIFSKPHIRILCLSATIPNADEFARWIEAIKEHPVVVVRHDIRHVPLYVQFFDSELGITNLKNINDVADIPDYEYIKGRSHKRRPKTPPPSHVELVKEILNKLPCLFFCFSRSACEENAKELAKKNLFKPSPSITSFIRQKLSDAPPEINQLESTRILRNTLSQGIGFHHAGLLPVMKDIVEELFSKGLIQVLYTTETFAVGINMPAKTVCFESLRKFDGVSFRLVNSKEFFQIAGRAGRRGIDTEGFVYVMVNRRDFDYGKMKGLTGEDTIPITSQFKLSVNTVLNLIKRHTVEEIDEILCKNFDSFQRFGKNFGKTKNFKSHSAFDNLKRKLEKLGYVREGKLTEKGEFASRIYADEILFGEIFGTEFYRKLSAYQMFILVACICLEGGDRVVFHRTFPSKETKVLRQLVMEQPYLKNEMRLRFVDDITSLVKPCYEGKSIFDMMHNTSMVEGDLVRFFKQVVDRLGQARIATNDRQLSNVLGDCQERILNCIKDIDVL